MRRLEFRVHAVQKMFERAISRDDVMAVIEQDEIIRTYPDDIPYPSKLILGWRDQRPLHVVAADNDAEQTTIVITVYEPDLSLWKPDFKTKKEQR